MNKKSNLKVGLLGGGSWGTTVAALVSRNAPVMLWARDPETVREINEDHSNEKYLPGRRLPEELRACGSIAEAVEGADVLIMGVPSHGFREVSLEAVRHIRPWIPVISLAKGLEQGSHLRMTQVIDDVMPGHPPGVLTGPNLAREIHGGYAAASVIAMEDETIVEALQNVFHSGLFRVYTNTDVTGCELGGALKNIIAIACGMGDGLGAGENTRSALITRGLAELTRLGIAMGGRAETFAGLAGIGDLIATCTSPQSRNRHVGEELGKGRKLDDIIASMNMVAEGVKTSSVVMDLAEQYGVEMPIAREVNQVIDGKSTPMKAFKGLLAQRVGTESDPG